MLLSDLLDWMAPETQTQILKVFGTFVRVYLVFGKIVNLFWQIIYDIEQIFTVIGKRSNIEIII